MDKEELMNMWAKEVDLYNDLTYNDMLEKAYRGETYDDWYHIHDKPAATPPNPTPEVNICIGDLIKWRHTKTNNPPYGLVVSDTLNVNGIGIGRGWSAKLQVMWGASGAISTVDRSDVQLCN
jgi:hypothetical protein